MRTGTLTDRLDAFVREVGAEASVQTCSSGWSVSIAWRGAPSDDSDGGFAAYGLDEDLGEAITQALDEAGV